MNKKIVVRRLGVGLCLLASPFVLGVTPAAAADVAAQNLVTVATASGPVDVDCVVTVGVATTTSITYVVAGTATTTGFVASATGGTCFVKTNYGWFGGASNSAPGNVSNIGPWTTAPIPVNQLAGLTVCAYGNAIDLNNGTHSDPKAPGC